MIEAIKEMGVYSSEKDGKSVSNPLDILIENPNSNDTYKNVFVVTLKKEEFNFEYKGIELEEFSIDKKEKYLYRGKKGNNPDFTPTSRINKQNIIKKTFNKRFLKWFLDIEKERDEHNFGEEEIEFLRKIKSCLDKNKEIIKIHFMEKHENIDKKENSIITLGIIENGGKKYVGDYQVFRNILENKAKKDFYFSKTHNTESISERQYCSVCNEKRDVVYGFVKTYKFYNVDKPGFVSGGFERKNSWKNYPVCFNCALALEAGKNYLDEKLSFKFYGFHYYLIPKFTYKRDYDEIFEIFETYRDPIFSKKDVDKLTDDEDDILEELSNQENYLNNNLMFYQKTNSAFRILLYIENILPSRLQELFNVKKEVDSIEIFKKYPLSKKKETSIYFNFGIVRRFFPWVSNNRTYDKYFLEIVSKIFTEKKVDYNFILRFVMEKIRTEFSNDRHINILVMEGFLLLNYLNKLKLLKTIGGDLKMKEIEKIFEKKDSEDLDNKIERIFNEFSEFFNSHAKKVIFLEGVLTQFLLNIQRLPEVSNAKPGKEPFRSRLMGLKLNEKQIKKLLPEIQNKFEQYGKNYYKKLEAIISKQFVFSGNNWKMNNDEISFYFVLGMNLSYLFKLDNEEKTDMEV